MRPCGLRIVGELSCCSSVAFCVIVRHASSLFGIGSAMSVWSADTECSTALPLFLALYSRTRPMSRDRSLVPRRLRSSPAFSRGLHHHHRSPLRLLCDSRCVLSLILGTILALSFGCRVALSGAYGCCRTRTREVWLRMPLTSAESHPIPQ